MSTSVIPKSVNPDLQKERDGCSFNSEEFAAWWAGGEEALNFIRNVRKSSFLSILGLSFIVKNFEVTLSGFFVSRGISV